MRFIENGPWIPDELLLARDQGRVVFFCGAGVSRARAGLPDFFGLARDVIKALGVSEDSAACRLIKEASEFEQRTGVPGVISADRIFGLLEREFDQRDIESAVAAALKPNKGCDVSAHAILLDLATTTEGNVQLVTTNFDLLFEETGRNIQFWQPPRLPSPSRPSEMNGIIYLHGRASPAYDGAGDGRFVLSSAEFGRAYLSEAWATSFIRDILQHYVVVFIGYSADDPPVQYLLEAMNRASKHSGNAYAFQTESATDATARWMHKGVEAILYSEASKHEALWKTLELWGARAADPQQWYKQIILKAQDGPRSLAPFERGQVAHIVSTDEGMKHFKEAADVPPAEWLCVFDRYRRFAMPGFTGSILADGEYLDPFDIFGLDQDISPEKVAPDDHQMKRDIPDGTWDAFSLNKFDRSAINDSNYSALRGAGSVNMPALAPRLRHLCSWIAKVAVQPAAIWWANRQQGLHPDLQKWIKWELERVTDGSNNEIRRAWEHLFEVWEQRHLEHIRGSFQFDQAIKTFGWSSDMVRRYAQLYRARLEVEESYSDRVCPPPEDAKLSAAELAPRTVHYPERHEALEIPDSWVGQIARALRENLELARTLELEVGGYGLTDFAPIHVEARSEHRHDISQGLTASVLEYASIFARLLLLDPPAARQEYVSWLNIDSTVFLRLKLWAAESSTLVPDAEFSSLLLGIETPVFWNTYHQPDLLFTLAARWNGLSLTTKKAIEEKVLLGPDKWDGESDDEFAKRRAWHILDRFQWLSAKGGITTFNFEDVSRPLRVHVPEWNPDHAIRITESPIRGGWVKTHTDPSELLSEPIGRILAKAREIRSSTTDFLNEKDPFSGVIAARPKRAFLALTNAAKSNDFPSSEWQEFLGFDARKGDNDRLINAISARLCAFPEDALLQLLRSISQWILYAGKRLASINPGRFDLLFQKLVMLVKQYPARGGTAIVRGKNAPDWVMEAINSPIGKLAQVLFEAFTFENLKAGAGFPPNWIKHVESLLALENDARRYALNLFSTNLSWFFFVDPSWTETALIYPLEGNDHDDQNAALTGFLRAGRSPSFELYARLKPMLLSFASKPFSERSSHQETLASLILSGWGSIDTRINERCVTDEEFRNVLLSSDEKFRLRVLWQLNRWSRDDVDWRSLVPELIANVWPRQTSVRSPETSAQLLNLLFSNKEWFPEAAQAVSRLLTQVSRSQHISSFVKPLGDIIEQFPNETLALLDAALPEDATDWPYGADEILTKLGDAHASISADYRFIRLNRSLNMR